MLKGSQDSVLMTVHTVKVSLASIRIHQKLNVVQNMLNNIHLYKTKNIQLSSHIGKVLVTTKGRTYKQQHELRTRDVQKGFCRFPPQLLTKRYKCWHWQPQTASYRWQSMPSRSTIGSSSRYTTKLLWGQLQYATQFYFVWCLPALQQKATFTKRIPFFSIV